MLGLPLDPIAPLVISSMCAPECVFSFLKSPGVEKHYSFSALAHQVLNSPFFSPLLTAIVLRAERERDVLGCVCARSVVLVGEEQAAFLFPCLVSRLCIMYDERQKLVQMGLCACACH